MPNTEVNMALNDTLEEANKERKQQNEAHNKRWLDNQATNNNKGKKPKKTEKTMNYHTHIIFLNNYTSYSLSNNTSHVIVE